MRFTDGTSLRLYRQTVEDFGLYPGMEISEETFQKLKKAAGAMSAKMRAVRIVAASSVSQKDLQQRLISKGEAPEDAAGAVQWMADLQLVDDRKTAQQVVNRCISKGYGIARAKQALYEKRIPKAYWAEALEDYPDQADAIFTFLKDRLSKHADERSIRRTVDALLRRGHSYCQIRRGLEMLSLETDEFPEE